MLVFRRRKIMMQVLILILIFWLVAIYLFALSLSPTVRISTDKPKPMDYKQYNSVHQFHLSNIDLPMKDDSQSESRIRNADQNKNTPQIKIFDKQALISPPKAVESQKQNTFNTQQQGNNEIENNLVDKKSKNPLLSAKAKEEAVAAQQEKPQLLEEIQPKLAPVSKRESNFIDFRSKNTGVASYDKSNNNIVMFKEFSTGPSFVVEQQEKPLSVEKEMGKVVQIPSINVAWSNHNVDGVTSDAKALQSTRLRQKIGGLVPKSINHVIKFNQQFKELVDLANQKEYSWNPVKVIEDAKIERLKKAHGSQQHQKPGENGKPVVMQHLGNEQKLKVKRGWMRYQFNQYISDQISTRRSLPDPREKVCSYLKYPQDLPQASIIICFHNEAWSTLLRTIHSVMDRSPTLVLREIILVDDCSTYDHLKSKLMHYIKQYPMIQLYRSEERLGLIRSRILGASLAAGQILVYLDSHCECTEGWLEPLVARIQENNTRVVCPVIDTIDQNTFEYRYHDSDHINLGGFDWNLRFRWHFIPERVKKQWAHPWLPLPTPTMAGGLFAIDKSFFIQLGTYDHHFDIWGGENLELSFKTWMCGGSLEVIPCSHVGHVFRKQSPYSWPEGTSVTKNLLRVAAVWLDDYAKFFYQRSGLQPSLLTNIGDISERLKLRKSLKCQPFGWYLKTVYPELFVPGNAIAWGELRSLYTKGLGMCIDQAERDLYEPVAVNMCHKGGGNQFWMLSPVGEIRRDMACLDYSGYGVMLQPCHGFKGNQQWRYVPMKNRITHEVSGLCLAINGNLKGLSMKACTDDPTEQWLFENYDNDKVWKMSQT